MAFYGNALNFPNLTTKSSPVGADIIMLADSAASNVPKQATISSLPGTAGLSWVLISTATPSGAGSANFTSGIDSTYDTYVFIANTMTPQTDATYPQQRVSTDGGSNWKQGASDYNYAFVGNGTGLDTSSAATAILMTGNTSGTVGNAAGEGFNFMCWMYGPSQTTTHKMFQITTSVINGSTLVNKANTGTAVYAATTAINGVQFFMNSGNISGTIRLYGIKKT